jgi:hypothetical protein
MNNISEKLHYVRSILSNKQFKALVEGRLDVEQFMMNVETDLPKNGQVQAPPSQTRSIGGDNSVNQGLEDSMNQTGEN